MSTQATPPEDLLVTALPPATDYITYLTLLEYQLTPHNLPTLNRLLSQDDGTLAEEIGWDLLKLVLPMLGEAHEQAVKCLEIIARRGNPREVVVRIAEILETLGEEEEDETNSDFDADGEDEYEDQDVLPTIAGEAERIHLGAMTLDGMPSRPVPRTRILAQRNRENGDDVWDASASSGSMELQNLLNMLGILHPRINTQYPSRFLATSLPAALRAYRRIPINAETTSAFVSFLGKLSSKQRPALPPRKSTTSLTPILSTPAENVSTSLPDPEAATESSATQVPSEGEKAIILRLLQAVLLEIFEEHTASLQNSENPCMSWTVRLRETLEPQRVVPGKFTESQRWQTTTELHDRDALVERCLRLSQDLRLDINKHLIEIISKIDNSGLNLSPSPPPQIDSPSEFPRSPADIPFSSSALILLFSAEQHALSVHSTLNNATTVNPLPVFPDLAKLYSHIHHPDLPQQSKQTPAIDDAMLSVIYLSTRRIHSPATTTPSEVDAALFTTLLSDIAVFSATCPDELLRDSAYAVATKVLHSYPIAAHRVGAAKSVLQDPALPLNLKAVAIDWMKDEFLAFIRKDQQHPETAKVGTNPSILATDTRMEELLFPPLAQFSPSPHDRADEISLHIPLYVSSMNLLFVLQAQTPLHLDRAQQMLQELTALLQEVEMETGGDHASGPPELWVLQDAVGRAERGRKGRKGFE